MTKRPAIQFYPGDWLRDTISGCSLESQGLWLRMMFIGHDSERYGYLQQNGVPIPPGSIARRCGCTLEQYTTLLLELDSAGVPSRTPEGIIFSRRMVRDDQAREKNNERVKKCRSNAECNGNVMPLQQPSSTSTSVTTSRSKPKTMLPVSVEVQLSVRKPTDEELIYAEYRHKEQPRDAKVAITKALGRLRKGEDGNPPMSRDDAVVYLLQRTKLYSASPRGMAGRNPPNGPPTPYPATWFNGQRYLESEEVWYGQNDVSRAQLKQQQSFDAIRRAADRVVGATDGNREGSLSAERADGRNRPSLPVGVGRDA